MIEVPKLPQPQVTLTHQQQVWNHDWSLTSIGAVEGWPSQLRTAVEILLDHPLPSLLCWGEKREVFYNETFVPFLGEEQQLRTRSEQLPVGLLQVLQPLLQAIGNGKASCSALDVPLAHHLGKPGTFWNIHASRVKDSGGLPGGVMIMFSETTQTILLRKEAEEIRDELHFAIEACDIGTWDLDPVTRAFTCNNKTKEIFGLPVTENVNVDLAIEMIHIRDRQRVSDAIAKALHVSSNGYYDIEYTVVDGINSEAKLIRAKGRAHFSEIGEPVKFSGTLQEVSASELAARRELEESEKRFRNLVQEAPVATAIYTGEEMQIQWANDAMIRLWGKDKSVIGKTVRQALPELEGQPFHQLLSEVFTTGNMYQATEDPGQLVVDGKLQKFYFNFSYKPLRHADGRVYGILNMALDVTESVTNKRRLEESEKNFRNLIMQAPVGICLLTGEDFVVDLANDEYLDVVGRRRPSFVGRPIWEVVPEAKEQGFDKVLSRVKETGEPFFGNETPVTLIKNGKPETVYVNFVYEPLFTEEKKVENILVLAMDVTASVLARKLVEDAEERARLAIDSANLGAYEVNLLTGEVVANKRFRELYDQSESALQKDIVSRIHPDDLPTRKRAHERALETGIMDYENRVIRRDGTTNWVHAFGQFYFDESGKPYKAIGIVRDITEEKIGEQEREKFLALAHYSRDFIGMCDMNMKTLYINKAGVEMLGIEGDVSKASLWDCFYEEDHEFLRDEFFPKLMEQGYNEVEIRFRHLQREEPIWVIYNVFLIRNTMGEPVAMATVSRDITDRKTIERELERRVGERTEELTKLNEELQQFTYVSSHDLKEPLRKIQVFSGMIKDSLSASGDESLIGYSDKVIASAARMSTLLSDLLNYSMLSDNRFEKQAIDLNHVVKTICEDMEIMVAEKTAKIHFEGMPTILGIPFQINQLFYNLIHNALKFSKPGEAPIVRIISAEATTAEINTHGLKNNRRFHKIEVIDNGVGFDPVFAEKIFVVFQRLHARSEYPGNGIGLSLCQKIVQNHEGCILAQSRLGEGSTFTLFLPVSGN